MAVTTLAASQGVGDFFTGLLTTTAPVPVAVIVFLAICVFFAVK